MWRHDRAHRFFSHTQWESHALGLALARLVVRLLVPAGQPVTVAIDDTLFRRTGPKVHAIGWFHDGSAAGPRQVGLGNNWVIAAIVVRLPFCSRPVALPVLAKLVHKDFKPAPASRLALARQMAAALAAALPSRQIHVVADAAYASKELARLPATVTWTTRLRKDAALFGVRHRRAPSRRRGRAPHPCPLVHHQGRTLHRRHDRQAPARPHRRQISAGSSQRADPSRNPRHQAGLGRDPRITAKVEFINRGSSRIPFSSPEL